MLKKLEKWFNIGQKMIFKNRDSDGYTDTMLKTLISL